MGLNETNSVIAICVAGTFCVLAICFAWCQWRMSAHDVVIRTQREHELTQRWEAYYESQKCDCNDDDGCAVDLAPPQNDGGPPGDAQ